MPEFMNRATEGMCERLGGKCVRKEHYISSANKFGATPRQFTSTLNAGSKAETTWFFWALNVPDEQVKAVSAEIAKDSPEMTMIGDYVMPYWLREFPCFIGCDITVCGLCNKQHEKSAIVGGQCSYKVVADKKATEKAKETARIQKLADEYQTKKIEKYQAEKAKAKARATEKDIKARLEAPVSPNPVAAAARKKALDRMTEAQERAKKNNAYVPVTPKSWAAKKDNYATVEQLKISAGIVAPGDNDQGDNESNEEQERKI